MSVGRFLQQGAAGNAGGATYVDDVFSTYLYTGTQSAMNITNGIDLDGEGGLVWIKRRGTLSGSHYLWDTERGSTKRLSTNTTNAEISTDSSWISSFNSDGFSIGTAGSINNNSYDQASWTFRKQPGFFDVVTYTGDGTTGRQVSHNLGSAPGMMLIKNLGTNQSWHVYHVGVGSTHYALLNSTGPFYDDAGPWNDTDPTAEVFTLGTPNYLNANGNTYVAYLFAHDAQDFGTDSDESIIKCGEVGTFGNTVDLGWEAQWIMMKRKDSSSDWYMFDSMRGLTYVFNGQATLQANLSSAESNTGHITPTTTGFTKSLTGSYVYVAIRRPHKPAEEFAATDLFGMDTWSAASGATPQFTSGFPVDMAFWRYKTSTSDGYTVDRLRGTKYLEMTSTDAEASSSIYKFDYMTGYGSSSSTFSDVQSWMFRRAPGFFDVVAYTGTGSNMTVSHNLNAVPELMIIKRRQVSSNWIVYHKDLGNTTYLNLHDNGVAATGQTTMFNSTSPTDSVFSLGTNGNVNANSSGDAIAYLFATVPGISKVGSYTSTGSDLDIDCGFTSGARFVLIRRNENSSDWHLFDTERGIVAGNDPFLELNTTNAQDSNNDAIDPTSSGFKVVGGSICNQLLFGAGSTYIFLAIA